MQANNRESCRFGAGGKVATAFLLKHVEQIKASSLEEVVIARLEESKTQTNKNKPNTVEWRLKSLLSKDPLLHRVFICY